MSSSAGSLCRIDPAMRVDRRDDEALHPETEHAQRLLHRDVRQLGDHDLHFGRADQAIRIDVPALAREQRAARPPARRACRPSRSCRTRPRCLRAIRARRRPSARPGVRSSRRPVNSHRTTRTGPTRASTARPPPRPAAWHRSRSRSSSGRSTRRSRACRARRAGAARRPRAARIGQRLVERRQAGQGGGKRAPLVRRGQIRVCAPVGVGQQCKFVHVGCLVGNQSCKRSRPSCCSAPSIRL